MKGKSISVYCNDYYLRILEEVKSHNEADEYGLIKNQDVLLLGLKLVKKYFQIKDPKARADIQKILEWI